MALTTWLVPGLAAAERVVFINTEPVVLNNAGGQDPTQDSYNTTGFVPGPASGWPGLTEAQQVQLLYWLKEASVPFDIVYTFQRPANGTYDMVVLGSAADNAALFPDLGCSAAIGIADCEDANDENISFLFWGCMNANDQADMHRVAFNIFAGLGFGWGLENLSVTGQIMGNYTVNALEFGNSCANIDGTQLCATHPGCADGSMNSTADLTQRIGLRVDDGPPVVSITAPEDNTVVSPDVMVEANVGDLFGGLEVVLEVVEVGQSLQDNQPPYGWSLTGIPQGTWTLRVTATDADMNSVSEEVTICVDLPECGAPPASDSSGGGDSSTGGLDTSGGGDSTTGEILITTGDVDPPAPPPMTTGAPSAPTTFGTDTPETGCQCRANGSGAPGPGMTLLSLLLLGAFIRRE
ncbi:MAG: hypothetical protein K0V04_39380 [Deltaproteobacteria bacterium]|nr:hypothetical protein [Deltaproteobacteria bacterium]